MSDERFLVTVFNQDTREIRKVYRVTNPELAASQCRDGEMWVEGGSDKLKQYVDRKWEFRTRGDGGPDDPGEYVAPAPVKQVATPDQIREEAKRRIDDIDWRVSKAEDQKDTEEEQRLRDLRQQIRDASNDLEKLGIDVASISNDENWPSASSTTTKGD